MSIIDRFLNHPNTTLGGTAIGSVMLGAGIYVLNAAHCDFSSVQWTVVLAMLFGGPSVMGGLATDHVPTETPAAKP